MTRMKLKVSDFAEVSTGGTPSTSKREFWDGGTIPWLNSGELNQDIVTTCSNYITPEGLSSSAARIMPPDTVLIALTGTTTGKAAYLTFEACANQSVTGILPSPKHFPKYLYHYLSSIRQQILNDSYGGAQKHISQGYVKNLEVPLPTLETQQKIAAILDKADALRQKDKQLLAKYDELAQAVFYDMFGDPVKNEKGWESVTIRDLITEAKYGTSKPAEDKGEFPYLRMNNITYEGAVDLSDLKFINLTEAEKPKYLIRKGDLLFNRTNSKELVGKTAVYKGDNALAIAGYLIRVRANKDANTTYISAYLNSTHGKKKLMSMCKSIVGMANINAQELQDIGILKPPVCLQDEFARVIDEIDRQKQQVEKQLQKSEELFQSLLQKAFNGELLK